MTTSLVIVQGSDVVVRASYFRVGRSKLAGVSGQFKINVGGRSKRRPHRNTEGVRRLLWLNQQETSFSRRHGSGEYIHRSKNDGPIKTQREYGAPQ